MIPDTSGQDVVLTAPKRRYRKAVVWGGVAVLVAASVAALATVWRDSTQSVSASRLRIAAVTRGTLVRDAAVNGRVVAAVSPTLFAPAAGTVTLKVSAGDTVKKGDVLVEMDSPDLTDQLKREQATYEQMQAEVARQRILARKQKLVAQRDADTAEIERASAQRTYDRIERAGIAGVMAKNEFAKAEGHTALGADPQQARGAGRATRKRRRRARAQDTREPARAPAPGDGILERRVDELNVRAPVDGVVGTLSVADRASCRPTRRS